MCLLLTVAGLFFALSLGSANAACQPGTVSNITYSANHTLQWKAALNPNNCTIFSYLVVVIDQEDQTTHQFQTKDVVLNYTFANFLEICKSYVFEVHAFTTDNVVGPSEFYNTTITPTTDVNLTLSALNVTTNTSTSEVNVTWNLLDKTSLKCVTYYRVIYWDGNNTPTDNYVNSSQFTLKNDIPCKNYSVQVNAIIANPTIDGPVAETTVQIPEKVPANPKLLSIEPTNSTVSMVWKLQPLVENYCTLSTLNVYTLGVAANISLVKVPIEDNVLRPNITFTLTGLVHAHVYTTLVNVQNHAGTSENVTVVYQTAN